MQGKCRLTCIGEIEKNQLIKSIMKKQVFFHLAKFRTFLFLFFIFWKNVFFTLYVTCYVIYSCRTTFKQSFTDVFQDRCSKKFRNIHRKAPVLGSRFNKVSGLKACILIKKKTPKQVFSWDYCKIFKNSFSMEHLFIIIFPNFLWW